MNAIIYVTPQQIDDYRLARETEYLAKLQPKFFQDDDETDFDLALRIRVRRLARAQSPSLALRTSAE